MYKLFPGYFVRIIIHERPVWYDKIKVLNRFSYYTVIFLHRIRESLELSRFFACHWALRSSSETWGIFCLRPQRSCKRMVFTGTEIDTSGLSPITCFLCGILKDLVLFSFTLNVEPYFLSLQFAPLPLSLSSVLSKYSCSRWVPDTDTDESLAPRLSREMSIHVFQTPSDRVFMLFVCPDCIGVGFPFWWFWAGASCYYSSLSL